MVPHGYAIAVILKANNGRWDNANAKSSVWDANLKKSIPAEVYGRYSRAEAAHKNAMENLPMFIGAVLAGNMAKLNSQTLTNFVIAYTALRIVYTWLYISISKHNLSLWRTFVWYLTAILYVRIYVLAGMALA